MMTILMRPLHRLLLPLDGHRLLDGITRRVLYARVTEMILRGCTRVTRIIRAMQEVTVIIIGVIEMKLTIRITMTHIITRIREEDMVQVEVEGLMFECTFSCTIDIL